MSPRRPEDIPADLGELLRIGTVTEVDLAQARCRVRYGDPDDESGGAVTPWVRWLTPRAGQTRVWSPPSVGEQVLLFAPDGQIGAAIALPGIVSDNFPPLGSDATEMIEWADGAQISYDPVGHILEAVLPAGGEALIQSPGGLTVEAAGGIVLRGDVTIEGGVTIEGTMDASGDVTGGGVSLSSHTHGGVQPGSGSSGAPN